MAQTKKQYWLMKTEADCYSIDDLARDKVVAWEGVRNYQARNFMMQHMSVGDTVFFYHSNGTKQLPPASTASLASRAPPTPTCRSSTPKTSTSTPKASNVTNLSGTV
jgi:predicted RNA-binding protein with PUA-like domain